MLKSKWYPSVIPLVVTISSWALSCTVTNATGPWLKTGDLLSPIKIIHKNFTLYREQENIKLTSLVIPNTCENQLREQKKAFLSHAFLVGVAAYPSAHSRQGNLKGAGVFHGWASGQCLSSAWNMPLIFSGVSTQLCKHGGFWGLGSNSHEVLWLCFKKEDESKKTIARITFPLEKQIASFPAILGWNWPQSYTSPAVSICRFHGSLL